MFKWYIFGNLSLKVLKITALIYRFLLYCFIIKVQSEYFPELKCEKFQLEGPICVGI